MGVGGGDRPIDPRPDDAGRPGAGQRLLETLRALLFEPGQLSAEDFAGRRAERVPPVAIFLCCAIAFFAAGPVASLVDRDAPSIHTRTAADSAVAMLTDSVTFATTPEVVDNAIVRVIGAGKAWTLFTHQAVLRAILATAVPRAAFLLMPFFALLTMLAWRASALGYRSHLAFAMHLHAACFVALLVPVLLSPLHSGVLGFLTSGGVLVYTTWYTLAASRRALGGTPREVNIRTTVVGLLYLPLGMAVTLAVALVAIQAL